MKKISILLHFCFILFMSLILSCESVFAQENKRQIVLLTSLDHHHPLVDIEKKLERIFLRKLRNVNRVHSQFRQYPLELKVVHKARQNELHHYLTAPETYALFWVSHGAIAQNGSNSLGLGVVPMILDYEKNNVANLFGRLHPNMSFMGIVGCNTDKILDYYRAHNPWSVDEENLPQLSISTGRTVAQFGLRRSLRQFLKQIKNNELPPKSIEYSAQGFPVMITRTIPSEARENQIPELRILNQGSLLGLFPKVAPGETQRRVFYIPFKENFSANLYNVEISTGERLTNDHRRDMYGELSVEALENQDQYFWQLFTKPDGTPFGVTSRIYRYRGVEIEN